MARQYCQAGHLDQAAAMYERILASEPGDLASINALLEIHNRQGREDLVSNDLQRLIAVDPNNINALVQLGRNHQRRGRFDSARHCFERALRIDPDHTVLYTLLARITKYTECNKEVVAMEQLYQRPSLADFQRRELAFSLGKIFDDLDDYDKAFKFFSDGNEIADREYGRPIEAQSERNRQIKQTFDEVFFRQFRHAGIDDGSVIAILGLPRSGTTLVESILASHSEVFGAGEAAIIGTTVQALFAESSLPLPGGAKKLAANAIKEKASDYLQQLKSQCSGATLFVDKSLGFDALLGLFAVMLPNAKIIKINRDPRDQGLSCFQKDFGPQQPYLYNLESVAQHYLLHADLMGFWNDVVPIDIHELHYENLVSNTETEIRNLLEFCGLKFESGCLRFHESDRIVRTESLLQIRQPINDASVGRWKSYKKHLDPLISAAKVTSAKLRN
jgi:tetratricopeptide (TPR) repeat protein